jgi:hypothetical protein
MSDARVAVVLATYSILGGLELGVFLATFMFVVPLSLQVAATPTYAGGYIFLVGLFGLFGGLVGLLAGTLQFLVTLAARALTFSASRRVRIAAVGIASALVAALAGLAARWIFGGEAVPFWLIVVAVIVDVLGLLAIFSVVKAQPRGQQVVGAL